MPRLIDDIRIRGVQMPLFVHRSMEEPWFKYAKHILTGLSYPDRLPVLLIDNVADYYYVGTGQEYWDLRRDFPNLAPPFPTFWCEHRLARRIHSDITGDQDMSNLIGKEGRQGVFFHAIDVTKESVEGCPFPIPSGTRWLYWMDVFVQYDHVHGDRAHGPHGAICMPVDEHGSCLDTPSIQSYAGAEHTETMKLMVNWVYPSLLAITFLHCKNVTIIDEAVPKPLAKKYAARHNGMQPVRYKTLVIEPLKAVLRTQGRSGEVGLAKALHICRGHFRDYREGRGLFGKYHALVWTPMTIRGTKGKDAPAREIQIKV